MKKIKPQPKLRLLTQFDRGYVRHWALLPADRQEKELVFAGLQPRQIYWEGRGVETFAALLKALRREQVVGVYGGLRVFGETRRQIMAALAGIEQRGGIVLDVESGDRSDKRGAHMLDRALARIRGEATIGDRAAELGALGGTARGLAIAQRRMPAEKALKIWRDLRIDTATALSRMVGWSKPTALRRLGKSGRALGPFKPTQTKRGEGPMTDAEKEQLTTALKHTPILTDEQRKALEGIGSVLHPEDIYRAGWYQALGYVRRQMNLD